MKLLLILLYLLSVTAGWAARPVIPGRSLGASLAGGQEHAYTLWLEADDYVEGVVDQRGIDVAVRVLAPGRQLLLEMDSPNGIRGPEPLFWIAERTGEYTIVVAAEDTTATRGKYRLRVGRTKSTTSQQRDRAVAALKLWQGVAELQAGNPGARTSLESAARLFASSGVPAGVARARYRAARSYEIAGHRREALREANAAAEGFRSVRDRAAEQLVRQVIGEQHAALGEHELARASFENARRLAHSQKSRRDEAVLLTHLGNSYMATSQYSEAEAFFRRALALHTRERNSAGQAAAWNLLGVVARYQGRLMDAADAYLRAIAITEGLKVPTLRGQIYTNLGVAWQTMGEYEKALAAFQNGLAAAESARDLRRQSLALNNIGSMYRAMGQGAVALTYHERSLVIAIKVNDRLIQRATLSALGSTQRALGRTSEAQSTLERALALSIAIKDRQGESQIRASLGLLHASQQRIPLAMQELERAVMISREIGDLRGESQGLCELGEVRWKAGMVREAPMALAACIAGSRETRDRPTEAYGLAQLMSVWRMRDRAGIAAFFGKQAVNRIQELRANVQGLGRETEQRFTQNYAPVFRELADVLISQGRLTEALQVLDLLKQEEFFELLRRDTRAAPGVNGRAGLTVREQQAAGEMDRLTSRVAALGARRAALLDKTARSREEESQIAAIEQQLESAQSAFQVFLDGLAGEFADLPGPAARVQQLREAQGLMEDLREMAAGTVAIYTLVSPDRLHVILVTPDVQRVYERPISAAALSRLVLEFRSELESPSRSIPPHARELFDTLIPQDLAADLQAAGAQRLMWSLDGVLRYLPVAALHDGKRYLVENYEHSVFTPASNARLKDSPKAAWSAAGFGVSEAHGAFPALANVATELHAIIRQGRDSGGVMDGAVMLDAAFTRDALRGLRHRYPVVHIASHFQFQPGNGADSFLLLGDGSRLSLNELRSSINLFGQVDLLTMSACNTAVGDADGDGREVESFAVLAQRQGAKGLLATLWPVADNSTSDFMRHFYLARQSRPGSGKAEALRATQIAMLRGEIKPADGATSWQHPFYWAPFILIGNWR